MPKGFGNAGQWGDSAKRAKITVDNKPAIGAIAYWSATAIPKLGHVGYVESVSTDGTKVTIEEYNYPSPSNGKTSYNWGVRQIDASSPTGYIHFKDLPGLLQTLTPVPQAILGPYGYIEVFAKGSNGSVWHICQSAPNSGWMPWDNFGGNIAGNPIVAINQNGVIQFFTRGQHGEINSIAQYSKGGAWGTWGDLGGSIAGDPVLGMNSIGVLQIFALGTDNFVDSIGQAKPSGYWGSWGQFGGRPVLPPVVAANKDGRLEVFATFDDFHIWHMWQTSPSGSWSGWQQLGDIQTIGHPVVGVNSDGRLEVFTIGLNGTMQECWQQTPNGNWSNWAAIQPNIVFGTNPSVGRDRSGNLNLFAVSANGIAFVSKQIPGGWSPWSSLGGSITGEIAVVNNQDGRLQIFGRGSNSVMLQQWQDYNGNWSGWQNLGDGVARF